MDHLNLLMSKDNTNVIDTGEFKIKDNILSFKNSFILIHNISHISVSPVDKYPYPISSIVLGILGLLSASIPFTLTRIVGLILIALCAYIIYKIIEKNKDLGEYLQINLNSGKILWFVCKDKEFLIKIIDVLKNCINSKSSNVQIDLQNSIVTIGNENNIQVDN